MPRAARSIVLVALFAFALSLARHVPFATDPFDLGFAAMNGGRFQGAIQTAWLHGGFLAMEGRPVLSPIPTQPPSGPTYASHPPLFHWTTHAVVAAFGLSEWTLRALPTLACAITAALLSLLAARTMGIGAAWVAAIVWGALPMAFFYGRMPNYESPVLLCMVAVLLLTTGSRAWPRCAAAIVFLGVLLDWAAAFVVPAVAMTELLSGRRHEVVPRVAPMAIAVVAAVAGYLALLGIWERGLLAGIERLRSAAGLASTTASFTLGAFLDAQLSHVVGLFGWIGLVAVVVGLALAVASIVGRRRSDAGALLLGLTVLPTLNVALFPGRSVNHDFWWYYGLPLPVLALAWIVSRVWSAPRCGRRLAVLIVAAVVAAGAHATGARYREESTGRTQELARTINELCGRETLLMTTLDSGPWWFYVDAWVLGPIGSPEVVQETLASFEKGELTVTTVALLCDSATADAVRAAAGSDEDLGAQIVPVGQSVVFIWRR